MLIVLRGSSGSGKSTLAAALQRELGWPTAILGQDHFRRVVYRERLGEAGSPEGMAHAALLETAARHCLAAGHHVIIEGILRSSDYAGTLQRIASTADDARFHAFDLAFDETVERHATRPQAAEFTEKQMREWYRGWDPLPFVAEGRIDSAEPVSAVLARILGERGLRGQDLAAGASS
jgi:predicted kinase